MGLYNFYEYVVIIVTSNMTSSQLSSQAEEPPMFLQRPSTARSQDVSHVLARTFRHLFTRDTVAPETVQYLGTSKGGDNPYHERYVERLEQVQAEHQRRLAEAAMLERHIMQAQARAMSADERAVQRMQACNRGFPDLGLPPARAHLRSCLDSELLRNHNLLTPEDYSPKEAPLVPPPSAPPIPPHARETESSCRHHTAEISTGEHTPAFLEQDSFHMPSESESFLTSYDEDHEDDEVNEMDRQRSLLWKSQMNSEVREANRQGLALIEGRVDHLRNPRFMAPSTVPGKSKSLIKSTKRKPKEICIKPKEDPTKEKESVQAFLPSPPAVIFKTYKVNEVYELNLELKNVSGALRPVRAIPPSTKYFSASLGQFPGEHGLVAPGMSCVYKIRFMPDSLIDFDDVLKIQTQASEPLEVPLLGRRPPPILSLPEAIDVGQCLVGGMKSAQFTVKNEGGNGRFCLMPGSSWPAANFKAMASVNTVVLPPFEICPPRFELLEGQSIMLEILFHPTDVKSFQEELVIVCDNCHVRHFAISGEGQTARVELVSVEEGVDEPLAGEQMDATADHLIRFSSLNPYTYIQKSITVRNMANVALPFSWLFVKPHIQCGDYDPHAIPTERVQEIDCVFSIEPETGILSPGSTATFSLTYAPPEVSQFHSVLHLVLRNIPTQSSIERQETRDSESGEKVLRSISPPIPAAVASRGSRKITLGSSPPDLTGLEISLKGECIPLQVLLQPCIVHIPGQILVETAVKQQFKLLNHSMTSVIFQWENISTGGHVIQVEPPIGELGAMCEMDFEVYVSGSEPGLIDHALLCHIQHLTDPLTLHVQAQIKVYLGPEVTIECADVSFGLVRFGESKTVSLPISNTCRVSTHWGIKESALHSEGLSEFTFEPSGGSLRPLESTEVSITWSPRQPKSVSSIFELDVENGSRSSVFAMGECQKPSVCLISCELTANEVYKDVPSVIRVEMLNQTLLDTVFKWGEARLALEGSDADKVSVRMEPASGHLEGRACFPISLHLMPHTTGALNDLRIPCEIAEMENPLILALRADVKGLSVEYRTRGFTASECRDEELVLDFGDDNPLGSTPKCELFIRNLSAVEATFSLNVERFFVKPPSPPSHDKPAKTQSVTSLRRPGMLTRTPNISDALSKTPKKHETDLKKSMLLEGKGAAFVVEPPSGQLQPFGQQRIQLTAFSDIWGQYTDQLICKIGDLEAQRIEMKMGVIGSPLFFQMLASQQNKTPVIRFGTHISEGSTVSRSMRINNPGPIDIRVDWETFVEKKNDAHQMLDLVLSYGKLFPRKDSDGIEILAEDEEDPTPITRSPTEFIRNSLDSTPAISRQPTRSGVTDDDDASLFAKSRPKVISVTLRVHEGHAGAEQYKVTPPQMVVPARGYNTAHVTFNPVSEGQNVEEENYNGFALGYLSLDSNVRDGLRDFTSSDVSHTQVSDIDGKVSRKQHYDVEPIRMKMTAAIKPAFLKIECFEDEGMRYRTAVSDLMREGQLMPECIKLCRATLSNPTETQLTFRLVTQGSFYIVEMDPHSHQPVAHMQETDSVSLLPQQSAVVQVGFRISLGLLELAESAIAWDPTKEDIPSSDEATEVRLEIGGQEERKLHLFSQLKIHFNNQHVQRLPLHATLAIPDLSLSNDTVDFGTCLVGQRREVHLVITNRTASDSFWTITQESKTDTVAEGTIEVAPTSGMLGAHVTHIAQNKALLQVFFTAKHAEDYEAVYVLSGMFGEGHKRLKVIGKGSYDGKHEALVNV
ncbi:hypothetical protein CAPTEDRAFT_224255 [Capitella teleta]|uniref:Deleted in lung and esophageal cancer protein 1 Ig-like domain-containing protein n=1 Tax=Capitella teleta TaxID=283909 RepID=R7VKQ0_CAPTE|nr:hypothetical protein CAPTEDRAFT_224255 [Capitella teleta]|eukprot:ELU16950.1 hypothetical protein CAPTEDRAFT_224255 [Capitella teleta]